ncbi:jupiter microtubule associated homolog 1 [Spea bombifrons]|uniref:jupiter microtubule associated homolog 1 n=1 Tax=Spea bombifrons TaxID=233779 RepID=UPI00234A7FDC|nr:jupiter microtubule associated homolog 1 [Spea bombifrons]
MTTTSTFTGLDPEGRNSSRVLRPPGGGSSFSFGVGDEQASQPTRRHKMASNIFDVPDYGTAHVSTAQEKGSPVSIEPGLEDVQRTCPLDEYNDSDQVADLEEPETESRSEASQTTGDSAAPAPLPSRRNPPGGKSSLVLG